MTVRYEVGQGDGPRRWQTRSNLWAEPKLRRSCGCEETVYTTESSPAAPKATSTHVHLDRSRLHIGTISATK